MDLQAASSRTCRCTSWGVSACFQLQIVGSKQPCQVLKGMHSNLQSMEQSFCICKLSYAGQSGSTFGAWRPNRITSYTINKKLGEKHRRH